MTTLITPLPTPPTRQDSSNFNDRADEFLSALPLFQQEANVLAVETSANSQAAVSVVNVTKWVSGTTYQEGASVWSPITGGAYRRVAATGSGVTDPSIDTANYRAITGSQSTEYVPSGTGAVTMTVQAKLREIITPLDFGAIGDGVTDDTSKIVLSLNALENGQTLDLMGRTYVLFVGNDGALSGDSINLADVPRLYNKSNITIRNGYLKAANPGTSVTKVRYPTTFTIDGCTGIKLENVRFDSRGESYGDVDASQPLDSEARRAFAAQNGGHALLIVRSKDTKVNQSHFERCGSCAAVYSMSSNNTVLNDSYSTAKSLGYAAYACDSWAGGSAVSGFSKHETILNNCCSDKGDATYGSKGCIATEDSDVVVRVNGGVYKDAFANGSAHHLGYAFNATNSTVIVTGAQVDNCASIGLTFHSVAGTSTLKVSGVVATNLRTAMHIQHNNSFGTTVVEYVGCTANITGTALWAEDELSVPTVIANRKVVSGFNCDIIDCVTTGAHTFAMNTRACYGGIRVIGGRHTVTDRIFDSYGWGGSSSNSGRGYEIGGGTKFVVTSSSPSTAKTAATTAINAIRNQDALSVFTYQYIDFDKTATVECVSGYQNFLTLATLGSGLQERQILAENLIGARQNQAAGVSYATRVKVISQDGVSGSNVKVTFAFLDNKWPSSAFIVGDTTFANRQLISSYAGPAAVGSELQGGFFVNGTSYNLTVGSIYNLISS